MPQKIQDSTLFYEKYQIQNEIGRGASGVCYKIKKKDNGKTYALKKISSSSLKKNNVKAAYSEVSILSSLKHPNIIKYYQSFMDTENLYIVMQYAAKGDLHSILKKRKIRKQHFQQIQIWSMLHQLLSALQYLHNKNIIHRDVKTLNILVDQNNQLIIGDLGVSKIIKSDLGLYSRVGTPLYLAPQIIKYEKYDYKADVWGLGCVSYLLATFTHPFQGKNIISLGQNIVNCNPKPIAKYSNKLQDLIFEMLQKNHVNRSIPSTLLKKYFQKGNLVQINSRQIHKKQQLSPEIQIQQISQQKQKYEPLKKECQKKVFRKSLTIKKLQKQPQLGIIDNKMISKGSQNLRYQKKLTYLIGNFVNDAMIPKAKEAQLSFGSNNNLDNTIILKPRKFIKEQDYGNEQITKYQKQLKNSIKKSPRNTYSMKNNNQQQVFTKQQVLKKPSGYKEVRIRNSFQRSKNNNFSSSAQCFRPMNEQIFVSVDIRNEFSQLKKNSTETKYQNQTQNVNYKKQCSATSQNFVQKRNFVRSFQQIPTSQNNKGVYIDIFKMGTDSLASGNALDIKGVNRYKQRPKSSIGRRQKHYESSQLKSKKKEQLWYGFPEMVETKILKRPQIIML